MTKKCFGISGRHNSFCISRDSLIDDKPIITLPEETEIVVHITLGADELAVYCEVECTTRKQCVPVHEYEGMDQDEKVL